MASVPLRLKFWAANFVTNEIKMKMTKRVLAGLGQIGGATIRKGMQSVTGFAPVPAKHASFLGVGMRSTSGAGNNAQDGGIRLGGANCPCA
jgi:hypothetical protein